MEIFFTVPRFQAVIALRGGVNTRNTLGRVLEKEREWDELVLLHILTNKRG